MQEADVGRLSLFFKLVEFHDSGCEELDMALVGRPYNSTEHGARKSNFSSQCNMYKKNK